MSGSCQLILPEVREWSESPLRCPGTVRIASRMSRCGREALPDVREQSGCPPGCPGVVWSPSRMSVSG